MTTLFLLISFTGYSQDRKDIGAVADLMNVSANKDDFSYAKKINNELDAVVSGAFLFYKYFVSSQDKASCVFYPSCSVYAIQSVQKHGIIIGMLAAFDRLTRCNGLSGSNYEIDPETHLFYDPVQ